jgi:hypothetical protein
MWIDGTELQEWMMREGLTFPAMSMDGMQPNFFTINGKAYPAAETIPRDAHDQAAYRIGSIIGARFA